MLRMVALLGVFSCLGASNTPLELRSGRIFEVQKIYRISFAPRLPFYQTGSELKQLLSGLSQGQQEIEILRQLRLGNVPDFMRQLVPVNAKLMDRFGHERDFCFWATPDYISIGSNEDFLRVPLQPDHALQFAREFNLTLPTTKIVDLIYENSQVRLAPRSLPPSQHMISIEYIAKHNQLIEAKLGYRERELTSLVAGHKKDVVINPYPEIFSDRVAIYGWHRLNGQPIQPLNLDHRINYWDYSHGVRLVGRVALMDEKIVYLDHLLENPETAQLFTKKRDRSASN